jgi:hypothetical protein
MVSVGEVGVFATFLFCRVAPSIWGLDLGPDKPPERLDRKDLFGGPFGAGKQRKKSEDKLPGSDSLTGEHVCLRPVATGAISLHRFIARDRTCQPLAEPTSCGG